MTQTLILTSCPRCESEQRFMPKLRETEFGWQEEYIRCTICRWEMILRHTTPEIEMLSQRIRRLLERIRWEEDRHGQASQTLQESHLGAVGERSVLLSDLNAKVQEVWYSHSPKHSLN